MLIVVDDPERVEADLLAGDISCPACGGTLGPWWFARPRKLRDEAGSLALRPRRGRCRGCKKTQVLLPDVSLRRRVDTAAVIGAALIAASQGLGYSKVADEVDRPFSTVRGWLRRAKPRAARIEVHFVAWGAGYILGRGGVLEQRRSAAAVPVGVRVAHDGKQPRPGVGAVESVDCPVGPQQRVLHQVLRVVLLGGHGPRHVQQHSQLGDHEPLELLRTGAVAGSVGALHQAVTTWLHRPRLRNPPNARYLPTAPPQPRQKTGLPSSYWKLYAVR